MFELFHIKIKMFKVKISNLFVFPGKWYFLHLQMPDFITVILLKYFNDYHTPPKKQQYCICFISAYNCGEGG